MIDMRRFVRDTIKINRGFRFQVVTVILGANGEIGKEHNFVIFNINCLTILVKRSRRELSFDMVIDESIFQNNQVIRSPLFYHYT